MWKRLTPYLLLTGLGLLLFIKLVLHPDQVLYGDYSDLLAEHIPAKRFLVGSWQETGEVPRWCPYLFSGMPFVADLQVAAYYPLHWPLYLLSDAYVGTGVSWLLVLHLLIAGWTMYAYAAAQGLRPPGALLAAGGYMLTGKWLMHLLAAGHYITIGLAWLPLVLLWLEWAIRRRSLLYATGAGLVFALLALCTHPQWTLYAGLLIALWTLGTALHEAGYLGGVGPRSRRRLFGAAGTWLGFGGWTAMVAGLVCAVQFLPTLEAAQYSTRAGGVVDYEDVLLGGRSLFLTLVSPLLQNIWWEYRGRVDMVWLATAALAFVLCPGRGRYQCAICVLLIAFAVGGAVVVQALPGFRLFRQPVRMLIVAGFPVAFLAGAASDSLFGERGALAAVRRRAFRVWLTVLAFGVGILLFDITYWLAPPQNLAVPFLSYWVALAISIPGMLWLFVRRSSAMDRRAEWAWVALLLANAWTLAWPLIEVRPSSEIFAEPACARYVAEHRDEHGRVLAYDGRSLERLSTGLSPLGSGEDLAMIDRIESLRGYNPLDLLRYKDYLQFMMDQDVPIVPFEHPRGLAHPIINEIPLVNQSLVDLLSVRYVLWPDRWRPDPQVIKPPKPYIDMPRDPRWRAVLKDEHSEVYALNVGGVRELPPYTVYENRDVMPRAFIVAEAGVMPERSKALAALKATDFRRTVLLENFTPGTEVAPTEPVFRAARIEEYRPNQVVIAAGSPVPSYLVLADIWYPGWTATVDDRPAEVYRANFLFRAIALPAGEHQVVFRFAPSSHVIGKWISAATLFGCGVLNLTLLLSGWARRRRVQRAVTVSR